MSYTTPFATKIAGSVAFHEARGLPGGSGSVILRGLWLILFANLLKEALEIKTSYTGLLEVRIGLTKYACHPNGSSARGETVSTPAPRSARILYRTTLRFAWPGKMPVKWPSEGAPEISKGTVKRVSFVVAM